MGAVATRQSLCFDAILEGEVTATLDFIGNETCEYHRQAHQERKGSQLGRQAHFLGALCDLAANSGKAYSWKRCYEKVFVYFIDFFPPGRLQRASNFHSIPANADGCFLAQTDSYSLFAAANQHAEPVRDQYCRSHRNSARGYSTHWNSTCHEHASALGYSNLASNHHP